MHWLALVYTVTEKYIQIFREYDGIIEINGINCCACNFYDTAVANDVKYLISSFDNSSFKKVFPERIIMIIKYVVIIVFLFVS